MCGLCGKPRLDVHWSAPVGGIELQRSRLERIAFLNELVKPSRVRIRDFSGTGFSIHGPTGKTIIVYDLEALFDAVDSLSTYSLDPLLLNLAEGV